MPSDVYGITVTLPLEKAREIVRGVLEEGRRRELMPLTVVVLDAGGHPVALEREDGAGVMRAEIAHGKAYAALGLGIASRVIGARNEGREAFLAAAAAAANGRFVPVAGGVLVLDPNLDVLGAVGVSGDTSDADEACALAGIGAAGLTPGIDAAED